MTNQETIYNVATRPARVLSPREVGTTFNPLKYINLAKPFFTTLAPIVTQALAIVLKGEWGKGRPVVLKDLMVTMRDGIKTAINVYFPKKVYKNRLKCPTVMIRTPYWKDELGNLLGSVFTKMGMVCVVQDIRGTGHSNQHGVNNFMMFERFDGLDMIAWLKKTFWFNGKIGTWGASYLGMTQWCIYDNKDITAFNTQVSSPRNIWMQHNGLGINETSITLSRIHCDAAWFHDNPLDPVKERKAYWRYTENFLRNPAGNMYNAPLHERKLSMDILEELNKEQAFARLKELYGVDLGSDKPDPVTYQKFVNEIVWSQDVNRFHEYMTSNVGMDYSRISRPFLMIAGWYDMFIRINMMDFQSFMARATPFAKKNSKMVIGPWVHGGVNHPEVNNLFDSGGFTAMIDKFADIDWFRYWLKDAPSKEPNEFEYFKNREKVRKEFIEKPPLLIYTIGSIERSRWRWEREWPLARTKYTNLYLHSSGRANSRNGDGTLDFIEPTRDEQHDTYEFDPANPVVTIGGNNLTIQKGAMEQSRSERRDDVLVYTSKQLDEGIEITGPLKVVLHASTSAVDTDFMVKLCHVYPNGKSYNISDLGIRTRYRDGVLKEAKLLKPGKIYRFEFEIFPTSTYIQKGHRLRVHVTSSDFPKYNVNSNMGGRGNKGDYTIAKQAIYHDTEHPSYIVLPVIPHHVE
ncbi:MAG: CocE/NonD family hydrolase [Promethearchaeota archaeon]